MAIEGELEGTHRPRIECEDCGSHMDLRVCSSAAGHYLGYWCDNCGPWSRETEYMSREQAEVELGRRHSTATKRNTEFTG